jgi:hypothetical protein
MHAQGPVVVRLADEAAATAGGRIVVPVATPLQYQKADHVPVVPTVFEYCPNLGCPSGL